MVNFTDMRKLKKFKHTTIDDTHDYTPDKIIYEGHGTFLTRKITQTHLTGYICI